MANDARVVVDTIQTGGIPSPPVRMRRINEWQTPPLPMPGPTAADTAAIWSLQNIAEFTGGQSSVYAYADRALTRIDQLTRSGYLLGYYPSNTKWDGRYRRIAVKVNRPGVTVLFRHGYYGQQQIVPYDRRAFLTYSRIAAAGAYTGTLKDISLTLTASLVKRESASGSDVLAEVRIDPARVSFTPAGDRHTGQLEMAVFCGDHKRALVGEQWTKMDLNLGAETYQRVIREGLVQRVRVPVKARPRYVKIVVYDQNADVLGSAVTEIR
jgi:hypothetical protein